MITYVHTRNLYNNKQKIESSDATCLFSQGHFSTGTFNFGKHSKGYTFKYKHFL